MYEIFINLLINNWRKVAFVFASLVFLVLFVAFYINNALIFIEISSIKPNSIYTTYANLQSESVKVGSSGLIIVPRSTKSITVEEGAYKKTQTSINIPFYGYLYKKISIDIDKNTQKIPFRSLLTYTCPSYNPSSDSLLYYDCNKPQRILRYAVDGSNTANTQKITDLNFSVSPIRPFLGGVIGISYFPNSDYLTKGEITFVDTNGTPRNINKPTWLEKNDLLKSKIYTNTKDTGDKNFAIVDQTGRIFIGRYELNKQINYRQIEAPKNYTANYNQTLCNLTTDHIFCYVGRTGYGEYPKSFSFDSVASSQVTQYTFKDDTIKTYSLSENLFGVDKFTATKSNDLYITINKRLLYLEKTQNGIINTKEISQNVDDIFGSNRLLFIQNNGVFSVENKDKTTSRQIFYSPNIRPQSLYAPDDNEFILAKSGNSKKYTYAYKIIDTENNNPGKRLIDVVPFGTEENKNIYSSDLINETVYVNIIDYNQNESPMERSERITSKKDELLNFFNEKEIKVSSSSIIVN